MSYIVTADDKDYIRGYVASGETDAIKKERRKECATVFGLSIPQVAAITAHTTIRANKLIIKEEISAEIAEIVSTGARYNYDNPIKQKYRSAWKNFIAVNTKPEQRRNMKVLCLPGVKCLEIPLYLDLGFQPHNIVGVECEPSAFKEFLKSASEYGISVRTTDIINVVNEDEWDVVNLDFTANVSVNVVNILRNLYLSNNPLFAINLLSQREGHTSKHILDLCHFKYENSKDQTKAPTFLNMLIMQEEKRKEMQAKLNRKTVLLDAELADKRESTIPVLVHQYLGEVHRQDHSNIEPPKLDKQYQNHQSFVTILSYFFKVFWRTLVYDYKVPMELTIQTTQQLQDFYRYTINPGYVIDEVEQYSYVSPNGQPYLTDMYNLSLGRITGTIVDSTIKFINQSLEALSKPKDWYFQVRDRKLCIMPKQSSVTLGDSLELIADGSCVANCQLRAILSSIARMRDVFRKDKFTMSLYNQYTFNRIPL